MFTDLGLAEGGLDQEFIRALSGIISSQQGTRLIGGFMANPSGLLTQNMSPEQARLLDQQLRDTQFQGQQYGGRTGGFMTAASGAIQGRCKGWTRA